MLSTYRGTKGTGNRVSIYALGIFPSLRQVGPSGSGVYNAIYNTTIVLWAFLSQTLSDGKMRSCSTAVARIIAFVMSVGKTPPSTNTGDYCTAREKLNVDAIHELLMLIDRNTRTVVPENGFGTDVMRS